MKVHNIMNVHNIDRTFKHRQANIMNVHNIDRQTL